MANIKTRKVPTFDPYDIKKSLVDLAEEYFNVQNVDLYESGFLGYVIQSLTHLTSDMLFQNALAYNEAFLIRANLPSSVYNIATQLDYDIQGTIPAYGNLRIIMPLSDDDMTVKIPVNAKVSAGNAPYKIKHNYYITKNDSGLNVLKQDITTGMISSVPYKVEMHSERPCLVFEAEIWQIEMYTHDFNFENTQLYVFYEETISGFDGSVHEVIVNIEGERYKEISSIYQANSNDKVYELILDPVSGNLTVKFGNGIYGYLPKDGAEALITVYTTKGIDGNISANTAKLTEKILNTNNGNIVNIISYNPLPIKNGYDGESLEDVKRHTIENISSAKRLVTEKDYKGFQGITGLTDVTALPVLMRRDVYGNEIDFFIVKYDENNTPIPTATIPVEMNNINNVIEQGDLLEYDGITYRSPFRVTYDDSYDIPLGRYSYSLSNLNISPNLFIEPQKEDILMGIRNTKVSLYPIDNKFVIIAEVYKLADMDAKKIKGEIQFEGLEKLELSLSKVYDDGVTCILSSDYIDFTEYELDPGSLNWTIYLYWDNLARDWNYRGDYDNEVSYAENDVVIFENKSYIAVADNTGQSLLNTDYWENLYNERLYNIYRGKSTLFRSGIPVDDEITSSTLSVDVPAMPSFEVYNINFKYYENLSDKCTFSVDVIKLSEEITSSNVSCVLTIDGNEYEMKLSQTQEDRITFITDYIPLTDFNIGTLDWTYSITYNSVTEHTFYGTIDILVSGKRPAEQTISSKPIEEEIPRIELVRLGLDSIEIEKNEDNTGYKFICNISKLTSNNSENIGAQLIIGNEIYNLTYVGDTPEDVAIFESEDIFVDSIALGLITFRIDLLYKGEAHSSYQQSAIFKHDLTPICFSNIAISCNGIQYAYGVPVIKQEYYDNNIDFIDTFVLNQIAQFREQFAQYKMLTDKINIKFVKTFGKTKNMQLNTYNPTSVIIYDDDFEIELPPKINVSIYVKRDTNSSINEIISECKNVLYTFLTLKAGFHSNIYRSEIARYLHNVVDDVQFCEVEEPTKDIVFNFNLNEIPKTYKDVLYQYCPEFIWFDKDKIEINVVLID